MAQNRMPHSVLIVDDDALTRSAYRSTLDGTTGWNVVAEASDLTQAVEIHAALLPDITLMDMYMGDGSSTEAIRNIKQQAPDATILALSTSSKTEHALNALHAGASGYLVKDQVPDLLCPYMQLALHKEMPVSVHVRQQLMELVSELHPRHLNPAGHITVTEREKELLSWLAHGYTNAQIGARMFLSEGSVKQLLARLAAKMGVHTRTQVIARAIQAGILDVQALQ